MRTHAELRLVAQHLTIDLLLSTHAQRDLLLHRAVESLTDPETAQVVSIALGDIADLFDQQANAVPGLRDLSTTILMDHKEALPTLGGDQ